MSYATSAPRRPNGQLSARGTGGDGAYVLDTKKIQEAVALIKTNASKIRAEATLLRTTATPVVSKKKVNEAVHAARLQMELAMKLLRGFPTDGQNQTEQKQRQLMHQKLSESVMEVSRDLEACTKEFERAEEERSQKDAAAAAKPTATVSRPPVNLEMGQVEGFEPDVEIGRARAQLLELRIVEDAELDVHSAIVDEYVQEVSALQQDIVSLQSAMNDLATHTQAQGVMIDTIEDMVNSTQESSTGAAQQLLQAQQLQRRGNKLIYWLLLLALLLSVAIVVAVIVKSS